MKTFRVYAVAIGAPHQSFYKPREDFGTIEAASAMRALDEVARRLEVPRVPRTHSIAVLGVGSIKVEEVAS